MPEFHLDLVVVVLALFAVLILAYVALAILGDALDTAPAARVAGLDEHGYPLALGVDADVTRDLTGYIPDALALRGGRHRPENVCRVDATYRPVVNARFARYLAASTPERGRMNTEPWPSPAPPVPPPVPAPIPPPLPRGV